MSDDGQPAVDTGRCEQCGGPLGDNPRRRVGHSEVFCSRRCSDNYWSSDAATDRGQEVE